MMVSPYVMMINTTFQILSMLRFSWIITECRKAVPVNQGMKAAFSTGSQAQKPPHPNSSYAHCPPRINPIDRKYQETRVQRRVVSTHSLSNLPRIIPAIANAKGTLKPMKPRYNEGG